MDDTLNNQPNDTNLIIAGDFNACIGTRTLAHKNHIGPYGIKKKNKGGKRVIELMQQHRLRAAATFFKSKRYATYYDPLHKFEGKQLDLILTSTKLGNKITQAGVYYPKILPDSDHRPTRIKLRPYHRPKRNKTNHKNNNLTRKEKENQMTGENCKETHM